MKGSLIATSHGKRFRYYCDERAWVWQYELMPWGEWRTTGKYWVMWRWQKQCQNASWVTPVEVRA